MEDGGIVLVRLLSAKCCVQCMYFLMASVSSLIRNDKHFEFYILFYFFIYNLLGTEMQSCFTINIVLKTLI